MTLLQNQNVTFQTKDLYYYFINWQLSGAFKAEKIKKVDIQTGQCANFHKIYDPIPYVMANNIARINNRGWMSILPVPHRLQKQDYCAHGNTVNHWICTYSRPSSRVAVKLTHKGRGAVKHMRFVRVLHIDVSVRQSKHITDMLESYFWSNKD